MVINGINSGIESADRVSANMTGSISRDPAVVSVPPQESRPVIVSAHVSSVNDIVSFLNSKNSISSDKDLDLLADAFHYLSVSGNISDIPKIFENTADTKIFAACLRWGQTYPGDGKEIEWALQNTYRGPVEVVGVALPRDRVRGLYPAYEIVKEGLVASMAEDLISVDIEQRHDIVGLYNGLDTRDLNAYRSRNGYTILGGILSADGRLAYSYNIVPPDDGRRKNGERNLLFDKPKEVGPKNLDKEAIRAKLEYLGIPWESVYSGLEQKSPAENPETSLKKSMKKIIPPGSYVEMAGDIAGSLAGQGPMPGSVEDILSDILDRTIDPLAEPNVIEDSVSGAEEAPFDGIQSEI